MILPTDHFLYLSRRFFYFNGYLINLNYKDEV